jgi:ABC-type Fe3+ transport system substrate-binding protein
MTLPIFLQELQDNFVKAGVLAGPIQWRNIFPAIDEVQVSPNGYFVGVGFSAHVIAYNPSLVPKDRIPRKWEDCLDPYWKGKFAVDTRPKTFAGLSLEWGEEKTLQYVRRLQENQPFRHDHGKRLPAARHALGGAALAGDRAFCGVLFSCRRIAAGRASAT